MLAIRLLEEGGTTGPDISWLIWVVLGAISFHGFPGVVGEQTTASGRRDVQVHDDHGHGEHH